MHPLRLHKLPFYGGLEFDPYLPVRMVTIYESHWLPFKYFMWFPSRLHFGPPLFILHINDTVQIPCPPAITLYADDTSVFFYGPPWRGVESSVNIICRIICRIIRSF